MMIVTAAQIDRASNAAALCARRIFQFTNELSFASVTLIPPPPAPFSRECLKRASLHNDARRRIGVAFIRGCVFSIDRVCFLPLLPALPRPFTPIFHLDSDGTGCFRVS